MIKNNRTPLLLIWVLFFAACQSGDSQRHGYQGIVELDEVLVAFEVPGRVLAVNVARGQGVSAGQVVGRLDDALAVTRRDARKAELDAANAQAALLRAGSRPENIRASAAELEGARSVVQQIKTELARQQKLLRSGASTTALIEDVHSQIAQARANVQVLQQRLRLQRTGARTEEIAAANAHVKAATAALAAEELNLARHNLLAPLAGEALDVPVKAGEVVNTGTPIVVLGDIDHPFVDVFVPQQRLAGIRPGLGAKVGVDSLEQTLGGRVEYVARQTEFTPRFLFSQKERPNLVVRVRVRVADPDHVLHAGVPAFVTWQAKTGRAP